MMLKIGDSSRVSSICEGAAAADGGAETDGIGDGEAVGVGTVETVGVGGIEG